MDAIRKVAIYIFAAFFGLIIVLGVMMKGWGLEPKSWAWIIGGWAASNIISLLVWGLITGDD